MSSLDSAYRWLLFQVGLAKRTQDVLLLTEASVWEARFNQVWHYSNEQTLNEAFTTLKDQNLIVEQGGRMLLTEQGTVCWEQSFSPAWNKAYINYGLDQGITSIASASVETCVRVFSEVCFLQFVKLESISVAHLDSFDPLYWKRISPAFSLQFEMDNPPANVRYPISFLSTECGRKILADALPLANACRTLESKILEWYSSASMGLEWYSFPANDYLEKNSN